MNVLVPIDGSENSMRAVAYAQELAEKHPGTSVTILTVIYPFTETKSGSVLEKARERFTRAGLKVGIQLLEGDPAETIVKYANDHNADRIIMGSRGMSALRSMVLGSVSYKVLLKAAIPVTIIK